MSDLRPRVLPALAGLGLAIQFLTRIPLPVMIDWNGANRRWAARCYPLVGLLIGVLLAVAAALTSALPTPIQALVLLTLWVALSGGLHLDGVMDLADALGSNAPLERRWKIMKDPQVGSFGVLALVFLLAWKAVLLWWWLTTDGALLWLVVVPALARASAVALLIGVPAARPEGLAHSWQQGLGWRDLVLALVPLLVVVSAGLLLEPGGTNVAGLVGVLLASGGFTWVFARGMIRAFHGINGDMLGSAIEGGELWLLMCVSSWWWFATG
ncbi:adenosylcobinamide-GDP ribazoletransferase [Halomonas sp. BN3-1]|uniref:adenosylcobinamide-GDP ribazoletransferase n=1 Tax=unclassified Halomonas TaxID=2609666 RepID=UPI001F056B7D|nr:adenosylcobinamide-GDP ribazoletransferase [Halomonas sp. BN3-1]